MVKLLLEQRLQTAYTPNRKLLSVRNKMSEHATTAPGWRGTTICAVRKGGQTVIAGDGQVSFGQTVLKGNADAGQASA